MRDLTETGKRQFGWFAGRRRSVANAVAADSQLADIIGTDPAAEAAQELPPARPLFQRFLAYLGIYILDERPQPAPKWYAKYWSVAEERQRIRDGHPIPFWMMDSD